MKLFLIKSNCGFADSYVKIVPSPLVRYTQLEFAHRKIAPLLLVMGRTKNATACCAQAMDSSLQALAACTDHLKGHSCVCVHKYVHLKLLHFATVAALMGCRTICLSRGQASI